MSQAVAGLPKPPSYVYVDGNRLPESLQEAGNAEFLIKGDSRCYSIAAASVLAKVTRDRLMRELDQCYPEYDLAGHKGYPTQAHQAAVRKHGPSPVHRLTFAPLKGWYPEKARAARARAGEEALELWDVKNGLKPKTPKEAKPKAKGGKKKKEEGKATKPKAIPKTSAKTKTTAGYPATKAPVGTPEAAGGPRRSPRVRGPAAGAAPAKRPRV